MHKEAEQYKHFQKKTEVQNLYQNQENEGTKPWILQGNPETYRGCHYEVDVLYAEAQQ